MLSVKAKKKARFNTTSPGGRNTVRFFGFIRFVVRENRVNNRLYNLGRWEFLGGSLPENMRMTNTTVTKPFDQTDSVFVVNSNLTNSQPALGNANQIWFNSNAALVPRERDLNFIIYDPEKITRISLGNDGLTTPTNDRNLQEIEIDLSPFTNLELFNMSIVRCPSLIGISDKVTFLALQDQQALANIGNLPKDLETLQILDNADLLGSNLGSKLSQPDSLVNIEFVTRFTNPTNNFTFSRRTWGFVTFDISKHIALELLHVDFNNETVTLTFPVSPVLREAVIGRYAGTQDTEINKVIQPALERLKLFNMQGLTWNRDISHTDIPNIRIIAFDRIGFSGNVDMSGATALQFINIQGSVNPSSFTSLVLPTSGVLSQITLFDLAALGTVDFTTTANISSIEIERSPLDAVLNPNWKTQLNAIGNSITRLNIRDLTSVNGLGPNFDMSGLSNVTTLNLENVGLSGILTLSPTLVAGTKNAMRFNDNPGLTDIVNFDQITSVSSAAGGTARLNTSNTGVNLDYSNIVSAPRLDISDQPNQIVVDLSNVTDSSVSNWNIRNNSSLTTINLPSGQLTTVAGGNQPRFENNPNLVSITNLQNLGLDGGQDFTVSGATNLNIPLPFSTTFIPRDIVLNDCAFDQTNIDNAIDDLYTATVALGRMNRVWQSTGGTNAVPSGTFQAPAGYVAGVSNGTPVSSQERMFVMVNEYNYSFLTN